ncbi:hypothetical protein Rsub_11756 [Raphidocelis subcapitata]|uniref:Tetratricopeptide repeat n=1 Tax=Raphidocelis subcapitata TaxID=307507 RepID=A0A2V0PHQ7_9CHLO|nr:hypothetical protein Rsub_11756 [Raphidocelis subcapitata]|eukprot:GBF99344.1 hypothetical protein Rsub_11756 [Raphidocelis subcapitata]
MRSQGVPRKRSSLQIAGRGPEDDDGSSEDDDERLPHKRRSGDDRLPAWQVAVLTVAAVAVLMLVLNLAGPRSRSRRRDGRGGGGGGGGGPRCFPLSDTERVKLVGPQNKAVHRPVATASESTQALFDLGLLQAWGFERFEAAANFEAALRYDPKCAMCRWGLAYAAGPYPNVATGPDGAAYPVFSPSAALQAEDHATAAAHLARQAAARYGEVGGAARDLAEREAQITELMAARFAGASHAVAGDGARWYRGERRYAESMAALAESHVNDPDLFALAAEAFMNLRPWDYYTGDGTLRPDAARAEALLRRALALDARHPLALHLHIHVAEAAAPTIAGAHGDEAAWAGRALGSADALAAAAPQQGHLLHMPSHIYLRLGHYSQAVASNRRAYDLDVSRAPQCTVPYLPEHNLGVLVYAASMGGMRHTAEAFARGMRVLRERVSDRWMAEGSEWTSLPLVLARYGEWEGLLELAAPGRDARGVTTFGGRQYAEVVQRYARVLACAARAEAFTARALAIRDDVTAYDLAARGAEARQAEARQEMAALRDAVAAVPAEPPTRPGAGPGMYASAYRTLAGIHAALAEARMALLLNETEQALALLDEAVAEEEGLGYMEPPRLHQPLRQCLGWVLLRAGKAAEAAEVYSKDLEQHPHNGWSLLGLWQAARSRAIAAAGGDGGAETAAEAEARRQFQAAWASSEVEIDSSCPALARPFQL